MPAAPRPSILKVARASRCASIHPRASFHASVPWRDAAAGSRGSPKPSDNQVFPLQLEDHDVENQTGTEASGPRGKANVQANLRSRQARRRVASALPPVELPQDFIRNNVSLHRHPDFQPPLPVALKEQPGVSYKRQSTARGFGGSRRRAADQTPAHTSVRAYFETALGILLLRAGELTQELAQWNGKQHHEALPKDQTEQIARAVRIWDMMIDCAWQIVRELRGQQDELEDVSHEARPFWWYHILRDFQAWNGHLDFADPFTSTEAAIEEQIAFAERFDHSLPHVALDLPFPAWRAVRNSVGRELGAVSSSAFDPKSSRRPVTILSTSGYGGKSVSQAVADHAAAWHSANIVRLDAYDLSTLIGDYLGQNWAYSRGPVSMLGFRAAEINGKLATDPDPVLGQADEEDAEDSHIINLRASPSFESELDKIKQGSYDVFGKWESLKIDKILDHIIHAAEPSGNESTKSLPLIIHIHDYVELSMTLEGSHIISRLRALADTAWHHGAKIAILGTSSCEDPSEEYQKMIRELAVSDLVITRHLDSEPTKRMEPRSSFVRHGLTMQEMDILWENATNIRRMLVAMRSPGNPKEQLPSISQIQGSLALLVHHQRGSVAGEAVLPAPEVYQLASACTQLPSGSAASDRHFFVDHFFDRFALGSLRLPSGRKSSGDASPDLPWIGGPHGPPKSQEIKSDARAAPPPEKPWGMGNMPPGPPLNPYEKRISSGQINRANLNTTFDDVHVPKETVSALKLLTSLALVRPEAFSYGVLKQDKIPGCLLYGPPGTGKTMLAKAVAKESGANMLEISGASINDKWVGESEKLIRAVFTLAKRISPCVVFIDEADSLLASRSLTIQRGGHRDHLNQFLKEWDGLEETKAFIMVATNRPFDLDEAVLRRLPRKLLVDLPTQQDRFAILQLQLRGELLDDSVKLEDFAQRTPYYSGSDLKNLCVAAAMAAVEEENEAAARHTAAAEEAAAAAATGEGASTTTTYKYPERRTLRSEHFEKALRQIPASISEDMPSLRLIRRFDEEYGSNRAKGAKKKGMGFGILAADMLEKDGTTARVRPGQLQQQQQQKKQQQQKSR